MAKNEDRIWHAEVVGSYSFPMDMLRYDKCLPATEVDSNTILESIEQPYEKMFKVEVYGKGISGPTSGRWASFGWKVVSNDALMKR